MADEAARTFNPTVRWIIPQRLESTCFVGKEVVAMAHDLYIMFLNLRTGLETVFKACGENGCGDGVDTVAGHKSSIFAYSEKLSNARIFIMSYPTFTILNEFKDKAISRYKGLCLLEGDLVAGFGGFPNYMVSVWSWRTGQRLLSLPTGIIRRGQLYVSSRSHMMMCQSYGEGLIVWEVAPCFKECFMMRRDKEEVSGWEVSDPKFLAICWTIEDNLYAADEKGRIYNMVSDGIKMIANLEWSEDIVGSCEPCMCAFGNGILMYGPDNNFRLLLKSEQQKWRVVWKEAGVKFDEVRQLVSNGTADMAVARTNAGRVFRIVTTASLAAPVPLASAATAVAKRVDAAPQGRGKRRQSRVGRIVRASARAKRGTSPAATATPTMDTVQAQSAPIGPVDNSLNVCLVAYKQRNIEKIKLIAPKYEYVVTINRSSELCIYKLLTAELVLRKNIEGSSMSFQVSPVDPVLAVFGAVDENYGLRLLEWIEEQQTLQPKAYACLTHQLVTRVVFSPTGRQLIAAAMSAGHVFIYQVTEDYKLLLVRYAELGRGLADCFLMCVGDIMRAFCLVLFSDKYLIGERIICINAVTGKDNKFAGKMQGPYARIMQFAAVKDTMLAIPFLSRHFHVLKLTGDKGVTVSVRMGPIIDSAHDLKQFNAMCVESLVVTYGADGAIVLRIPCDSRKTSDLEKYEFKLPVSHRYDNGVKYAEVNPANELVAHLGYNCTVAVTYFYKLAPQLREEVRYGPINPAIMLDDRNVIELFDANEKNYLDLQEEKKVREEALDYKKQRDEVVRVFEALQTKLVDLLEENIAEVPLHQLSLSEFNLNLEHKRERLKQAEKEREEIRLKTEARIRAQDKVTAWIKKTCWDTMLTPRIKLLAIFSHYQVENYPVLPTQRDFWPELQQTIALRSVEMENDSELFRPWEDYTMDRTGGAGQSDVAEEAGPEGRLSEVQTRDMVEVEETPEREPYVLSGTSTHKFVAVPTTMIPQTLSFSFLQMNWLYHLVKLNVQNMRLWFNKRFDEMMSQKKREVGLVIERNTRLRFIIEELNKLSDLRGSFNHLTIVIKDPEWRQEETPEKLLKVDPEECTIPPYISPSQIVIVPPDPGPKDDFRERALMEMMDGVLEKLWHEEIKKPIPKPQCMLEKEPEHFNEEDLRQVFDYEAKVRFRNEERDKYRKMLHAEYAKLSQVLNEGIVKFNLRVKDLWLTKLKVDSVIGQENLNLMRLRRMNLDRVESAEQLEDLRALIFKYESEAESLSGEMGVISAQSDECQAAYDALAFKDRNMDRTFKNHFLDLSQIVIDQCYKFFKKRPKWHQRASMIPVVLNEMAAAALAGVRPHMLHPDCLDYLKAIDQLDLPSNMPAVMDEGLWATMCRLRRAKIENEIRMRAVVQETAYVDAAMTTWSRALTARRTFLAQSVARIAQHRENEQFVAINRELQLVIPAGQVEITTTGHMEDFDNATLIPRVDVDVINNLILKVGALKLRMMRRQMEFRKTILAKEWEHAQMKMKLRHMQQELHSYSRLRIPKELQRYLKNKEKGYTDEQDYVRLEKEMAANKKAIERVLQDSARYSEDLQVKISVYENKTLKLAKFIDALGVKVSEKRLNDDALEPIRVRRIFKNRMDTLVARSYLIRQVQANHTRIVLLQTELELLRLRTYPTLATFKTFC